MNVMRGLKRNESGWHEVENEEEKWKRTVEMKEARKKQVGKAGGGRMVLNRNEGVEPLGVGCLKGGPMTKGQHRTKDAVA